MPTYTYKCIECQKKVDSFKSMKESTLDHIQQCVNEQDKECTFKKTLSTTPHVFFKGSGFYETDYKEKEGISDDD
jgi:predicted nucleic acid-binding Zn ribbon protein